MFFIVGFVIGTLLEYDLRNSIGQLAYDLSGNNLHGILGKTLFVESNDAIFTDRGAYFSGGTRISALPNNIRPNYLLPISSTYLFLISFKPLGSGCLLSITNGSSTKLEICWNSDTLSFTQNGVTISQPALLGTFYVGTWSYLLIGYYITSSTIPNCNSNGIMIYDGSSCTSASSSYLSLSSSDVVYFGLNPVTSSKFNGFISNVYIGSSYSALLGIFSGFSVPTGSDCPLCASNGTPCNCGSYSCINNNPNMCNKCASACGRLCNSTLASSCLSAIELCVPYYYNYTLSTCDLTILHMMYCNTQTSSTVCTRCDTTYYVASATCHPCSPNCKTCSGPASNECLSCMDTNAVVVPNNASTTSGVCSCSTGYYNSGLGTSLACSVCSINCKTCTGSASFCLSCADSNAAPTGSGSCMCKSGYYSSSTSPLVCSACDINCNTCNGPGSCLACADPNALVSLSGSCYCKNGFYASSSSPLICSVCDTSCKTCSGPGPSSCLSCVDPNSDLNSGTCSCKAGFFQAMSNSFVCSGCYEDCLTCNKAYTCLSCISANSSPTESIGCSCNSGYYNTTSLSVSSACLSCNSNPEACRICAAPNCLVCSSNSSEICAVCNYNYEAVNGACVLCGPSQYYNSTAQACYSCNETCLTCRDLYECTTCPSFSTLFTNHTCICDLGYYWNTNQCSRSLFGALFTINTNKAVNLIFTQTLKNNLTKDDIKVTINHFPQAYKLVYTGYETYQLDILFANDTKLNDILYINFVKTITSTTNALLYTKTLEINLYTTDQLNENNIIQKVKQTATEGIEIGLSFVFGASFITLDPTSFFNFLITAEIFSIIFLFNLALGKNLSAFLYSLKVQRYLPNAFGIIFDESLGKKLPEIYIEYGMSTNLILINSGVTLSILMGHAILYGSLYLIKYFFPKLNKVVNRMLKYFAFNVPLRFWIQSYLEILLNSIIEVTYNDFSTWTLIVDFIVTILLIVLPK